MSKERLRDVETIYSCIYGGYYPRCEGMLCRWEMISIVVETEFVNPKSEKQTEYLCGNVDCPESSEYNELLTNNNVADNQKLIIKTYENDNGDLRKVTQVINNR